MTIWGQYRANCEIAGTPYIYKQCVRDECGPVEPHTTIYAEGEGGLGAILPFGLLFLRGNRRPITGYNRFYNRFRKTATGSVPPPRKPGYWAVFVVKRKPVASPATIHQASYKPASYFLRIFRRGARGWSALVGFSGHNRSHLYLQSLLAALHCCDWRRGAPKLVISCPLYQDWSTSRKAQRPRWIAVPRGVKTQRA